MAATRIESVTITGGTAQLVAAQQFLAHIPGATEKAIKRAVERTKSKTVSIIAKSISEKSNIKQQITRKKTEKGRLGKTGGSVTLIKSGRLGVRHFKAKHIADGVTYQINKRGRWLLVPGSFQGPHALATKVFEKRGKKFKKLDQPQTVFLPRPNPKWKGNAAVRMGKKRLPIVFIKGVSPAHFFAANKMVNPKRKDIADFFNERLKHEIKFILSKQVKGK